MCKNLILMPEGIEISRISDLAISTPLVYYPNYDPQKISGDTCFCPVNLWETFLPLRATHLLHDNGTEMEVWKTKDCPAPNDPEQFYQACRALKCGETLYCQRVTWHDWEQLRFNCHRGDPYEGVWNDYFIKGFVSEQADPVRVTTISRLGHVCLTFDLGSGQYDFAVQPAEITNIAITRIKQ